jgi:hypothetical protein
MIPCIVVIVAAFVLCLVVLAVAQALGKWLIK